MKADKISGKVTEAFRKISTDKILRLHESRPGSNGPRTVHLIRYLSHDYKPTLEGLTGFGFLLIVTVEIALIVTTGFQILNIVKFVIDFPTNIPF